MYMCFIPTCNTRIISIIFSNIKPLVVVVVGDNFLSRFFSYRVFKYNHFTKLRLVMIYENCRYNFYDSSSFVS